MAWKAVHDALLAHYHKPDLPAVQAVYSAMAAHNLPGQPVWPMLVAPPGSMKTEILKALKDALPNLHFIDQVTPNTFISGQIEDSNKPHQLPAGFLHRIGSSGYIVIPDFSTILALQSDKRNSILADLRVIFDGDMRKEFGTADRLKDRQWKGRITCAVATTPDIDKHYGSIQSLGERFVMIRIPRADGTEAALKAMSQDRDAASRAIREAVRDVFQDLPRTGPTLSSDFAERIAAISEFTVRARTHVSRDRWKNIEFYPEPESPTRLSQQFCQLCKGSALLSRRLSVHEDDYSVVKRVAVDCIPSVRRKIIDALLAGGKTSDADLPESTRKYAVDDLVATGLVRKCGLVTYSFSEMAIGLLQRAGLLADSAVTQIAA